MNTPDFYYEQIIALTKQDTMYNLIDCFVNTIKESTKADAVTYYQLQRGSTHSPESITSIVVNPLDSNHSGQSVESIDGLSECLITKEVVVKKINSKRSDKTPGPTDDTEFVLYPIGCEHSVIGVLVIECSMLTEHEHAFISRYICIFENLNSLLNKKERDTLTGLLNRQTYDSVINQIMPFYSSGFRRNTDKIKSSCLAIMDIDYFKKINDTFGHLIGDEVLLAMSQLMRKCFRFTDFLFRYGGEEFVVILIEISKSDAYNVLNRFRRQVETHQFPQAGNVTISIGYVEIDPKEFPATLFERADNALYHAKNTGRNRICLYDDMIKESQQTEDNVELWD